MDEADRDDEEEDEDENDEEPRKVDIGEPGHDWEVSSRIRSQPNLMEIGRASVGLVAQSCSFNI